MEDFGREEEEEEYDSVGSSTSSDLGGGEVAHRCTIFFWYPGCEI